MKEKQHWKLEVQKDCASRIKLCLESYR